MKAYVVTMYRCGDREKHSYVLGIYSTKTSAMQYANTEEEYRGNKYEAEILKFKIDADDAQEFPKYIKELKNS
jgi:hypothetical protein